LKKKTTTGTFRFFQFFGQILLERFLCLDNCIRLRKTKNGQNRCLLLDLSILNGPIETAVHGREGGGEGQTYNAPLREGWPPIRDHI